jgi:hypothetical protein
MMPVALTTFRVFLMLTSFPETGRHLARLVKSAIEWWNGKKIAVIGPTASGKDSFLARLQNQQIPRVHANSAMGEKVRSFPVRLALSDRKLVDITCKGVINIGGETDYRDDPSGWLAVCHDADVVFYMMTVHDLAARKFLKGRRVREDLDWLLTAMPHLKPGALVHILINKIDLEIESHTDYLALARELKNELAALDRTVKSVLDPYERRYTGATLISMKNKQIYTRAINLVFRAVYSAFHAGVARRKAG